MARIRMSVQNIFYFWLNFKLKNIFRIIKFCNWKHHLSPPIPSLDFLSDIILLMFGEQERRALIEIPEDLPVIIERRVGLLRPAGQEPAQPHGRPQLSHVHQAPLVHEVGRGHLQVERDHRLGNLQLMGVQPGVQVVTTK